MERIFLNLPDAINCSSSKNFTQVPIELLRNPEISAKAKAILCLLLSNKEGWKSCISSIQGMMKEKYEALNAGIKELEQFEYLKRVKFRNIKTKKWAGSFWAYTDNPGDFKIREQLSILKKMGYEIPVVSVNIPEGEKPRPGKPVLENHNLNILIDKNIKNNNINILASGINSPKTRVVITPTMFEDFWTIYPKKADKGKALYNWCKLCNKKSNLRPTWKEIKIAVLQQINSGRWQNSSSIPLASTWINQSRWLDDPTEMIAYTDYTQKNQQDEIPMLTELPYKFRTHDRA